MSERPVLLTVDDDPSVSRAVARDLRRRYGQTHRIVRSESGPDALAALNEFVLRGEETALLLADHRMPGMTGVEFLELAMDMVPQAKRVLLTAYADTDSAIRAINDVDLDRYLLKPWIHRRSGCTRCWTSCSRPGANAPGPGSVASP